MTKTSYSWIKWLLPRDTACISGSLSWWQLQYQILGQADNVNHFAHALRKPYILWGLRYIPSIWQILNPPRITPLTITNPMQLKYRMSAFIKSFPPNLGSNKNKKHTNNSGSFLSSPPNQTRRDMLSHMLSLYLWLPQKDPKKIWVLEIIGKISGKKVVLLGELVSISLRMG